MRTNRATLIGTAAAALGVFALLWVGYALHWQWLADVDAAALNPLHRYGAAHPGWVRAWNVFCTVLGPQVFRMVTLAVILVALVRRRFRLAAFLAVSVELSGVLTEIAKAAADRPRPATALVHAYGLSFPSGHALGVTVGVLALLTVALPALHPKWRGRLVGVGILIIVAIGVGRVVLNVHHPSDVIAGWAMGYAYFVVCLLVLPPRVTRADETPPAHGTGR